MVSSAEPLPQKFVHRQPRARSGCPRPSRPVPDRRVLGRRSASTTTRRRSIARGTIAPARTCPTRWSSVVAVSIAAALAGSAEGNNLEPVYQEKADRCSPRTNRSHPSGGRLGGDAVRQDARAPELVPRRASSTTRPSTTARRRTRRQHSSPSDRPASASSSPRRSRSWPARSAWRRGSRSASRPAIWSTSSRRAPWWEATRAATSRFPDTWCGAATPTPGPRSTSTASAGSRSNRRRAGATPRPVEYSGCRRGAGRPARGPGRHHHSPDDVPPRSLRSRNSRDWSPVPSTPTGADQPSRPRPSEPAPTRGVLAGVGSPPWRSSLLAIAVVVRTAVHTRRRSHARHDPHGGRVASAWEETISWLALLGIRPRTVGDPGRVLARAPGRSSESRRSTRWPSPRRSVDSVRSDPTEEQCRDAEQIADEVRDRVRGATTRTQQLRRLVR